ncbi:hypothetical protein R6Q57_005091 [Mikania cordata]
MGVEATYVASSKAVHLSKNDGDKIQATIKKVLMFAFENQLEEANIILLNRFGVGEMNFKYFVIKHNFKLNFYRQTNINRCLEFDGPLYSFRFVDFHQIINMHVQGGVLGCTLWDNFAQQISSFLKDNSTDQVVIVLIQFRKAKALKGNPNIQNAFFGVVRALVKSGERMIRMRFEE